ncbi:hypothetical protein ANN_04974 [Periplaneta americana]|uniref:Uncharacterized protein n=1 Tax=Periplaneta americana TaxID=6978 RepID=A0ABQ8T9U2_PERAM|nr:hypothetical protein ANN_04974 [Periplaneta americana]
MKPCEYLKVSQALYLWFIRHRAKSVPIYGPILKQKALKSREEFNKVTLTLHLALAGWTVGSKGTEFDNSIFAEKNSQLMMNNALTHPSEDELPDGEIRALFLLPNVMVICQPMDQGLLEAVKRN